MKPKRGDVFKYSSEGIKEMTSITGMSSTVLGSLTFMFGDSQFYDIMMMNRPHLFDLVQSDVFEDKDYEYV